ncbi:MAG: hypothetical protein ACO1NX_01505 [Chitinophagaceae bacterium]
MILSINDNKFIIDLQEKFSECFPYLKIEFYSRPCVPPKMPVFNQVLPGTLKLSDVRKSHEPGLMDIKSYFKTGQVEQDFRQLFGLNVQILRKENNNWIKTTHTKSLTLQQQSQIAELATLTRRQQPEAVEEGDYGYN